MFANKFDYINILFFAKKLHVHKIKIPTTTTWKRQIASQKIHKCVGWCKNKGVAAPSSDSALLADCCIDYRLPCQQRIWFLFFFFYPTSCSAALNYRECWTVQRSAHPAAPPQLLSDLYRFAALCSLVQQERVFLLPQLILYNCPSPTPTPISCRRASACQSAPVIWFDCVTLCQQTTGLIGQIQFLLSIIIINLRFCPCNLGFNFWIECFQYSLFSQHTAAVSFFLTNCSTDTKTMINK